MADDSQLVSDTTIISLNACVVVIITFCLLSGMKVNWAKTIAICCLLPGIRLPGELQHVWVLAEGETHRYMGVEHEAAGEDRCVGAQLVTKMRKKC